MQFHWNSMISHYRFIIKAPPAPPRQDSHLGNVIINEQKVNTVSKHQVNLLHMLCGYITFHCTCSKKVDVSKNNLGSYVFQEFYYELIHKHVFLPF